MPEDIDGLDDTSAVHTLLVCIDLLNNALKSTTQALRACGAPEVITDETLLGMEQLSMNIEEIQGMYR
jgi:Na+/serine symporter